MGRRREKYGGQRGDLEMADSREVKRRGIGLELVPREMGRNIMFHDQNNRDLERTMQDLAENVAVFRVASDLLKSRVDLLQSAISERL